MALPTLGQRFRLKQHVGYQPDIDPNDPFEQWQNRHWPLFAGQEGTVFAIGPLADNPQGDGQNWIGLVFEPRRLADGHQKGTPHDQVEHVADPENVAERRWSCSEADFEKLFEPIATGAIETAIQGGAALPEEGA
jgi:hypothetical protein